MTLIAAYCELLSDGSDYVSTDNYELTATFSELPSSTVSAEAYNTLCSYWVHSAPVTPPLSSTMTLFLMRLMAMVRIMKVRMEQMLSL